MTGGRLRDCLWPFLRLSQNARSHVSERHPQQLYGVFQFFGVPFNATELFTDNRRQAGAVQANALVKQRYGDSISSHGSNTQLPN